MLCLVLSLKTSNPTLVANEGVLWLWRTVLPLPTCVLCGSRLLKCRVKTCDPGAEGGGGVCSCMSHTPPGCFAQASLTGC